MPQISEKSSEVGGCRVAAAPAGIRYKNRDDLVLMEFIPGTVVAGVFTTNSFCAPPVLIARQHLDSAKPRFLLINAGNANAGTGESGMQAALASCEAVATICGVRAEEVLPFSTGVIGVQLPVEKIKSTIPELKSKLTEDGWDAAARAIMTTDTRVKIASASIRLSGGEARICGIAKGSGMIHPDMATMLAFITTDVTLSQEQVETFNSQATERSFNRISVDGDTSTNDACVLAATGASGVALTGIDEQAFYQCLADLYASLARKIVQDGEGASKFVTVSVSQGANARECLQVARAVSCSPLVKTAWYASDPNWGRILAAVGNAKLDGLDPTGVSIYLDDICIVKFGALNPEYREEQGQEVFNRQAFEVRIELGRGDATDRLWTCDLSHDYVTINAEYRS